MLRYAARPTPGRQKFEARVARDVASVQARAAAGDWPAVSAYLEGHKRWDSGVKQHFAHVQGGKCGYCERFLTDYGDVEHYRPKSAIFALAAPGEERDDLNNIRGRAYHTHPKPGAWDSGYWWLAYAWDNYLVACGRCNQQWKNALFPTDHGHAARPEPGQEAHEEALLLDPFGPHDPADHLTFTRAGAIVAHNGSARGEATIAVCGLDRPSLVKARLEKASATFRDIEEVALALEQHPVTARADTDDGRRQREARQAAVLPGLRRLFHAGRDAYAHAGMVRVLVKQQLGIGWDALASVPGID